MASFYGSYGPPYCKTLQRCKANSLSANQYANANTAATEYMTPNYPVAPDSAIDAMGAYTIKVKTVNLDEATADKKQTKLNTKDFDSVIDEFTNAIEMFPNTVTMNDGYEITQEDIDNAFVIPTPKTQIKRADRFPILLLNCKTINGTPSTRPLLALLDTGSTGCLLNQRSLPFGAKT